MYRKILLVSALCLSMGALLITTAHAYPSSIGGWGAFPKCVCVWSEWLGVANYEVMPTDVEVTIELLEVQLHYLNPSGKPGGLGTPFYPGAEVTGEGSLTLPVKKNGKYLSTICFTDEELLGAIDPGSIPDPPNPQWTIDPDGGVIVLEMFVTIRGYSDLDGNLSTETETAHVGGTCTLNSAGDGYDCYTDEIWGYKNKDPECPYE